MFKSRRNILLHLSLLILLGSCKTKADKAINKLDDWFSGFDSVSIINKSTKQYFKYTDTTTKEVAVESIIDEALEKQPTKEQIEFHDENNRIQSNYEWDEEKWKIQLNVTYTDPKTTKGMRFMVTVINK